MDDALDQLEMKKFQEALEVIEVTDEFLEGAVVDVKHKKIKPRGRAYISVSECAQALELDTGIPENILVDTIADWLEMEYPLPEQLSAHEKESIERQIMEWANEERKWLLR